MRDKQTLGPWIRRFLMEYLPGERNLARNTQRGYRDAIRLLDTLAYLLRKAAASILSAS